MMKLIAYHGKREIKEKFLARVTEHEKLDHIVQLYGYWKNGKGCAVGCTLEMDDTIGNIHAQYETQLGVPRILARLEDGIFETLPKARAKTWPREFLTAIEPGADLHNVWPQFAMWLMEDPKWGVINFAKTDEQRETIKAVADMYRHGSPDLATAKKVCDDADDAETACNAAYTARSAAFAAYIADSNDAAHAAVKAAYAAAAAYAGDVHVTIAINDVASYYAYAYANADVRFECREAQANKLLELMKAAPIVSEVA
jgi:hypothetical protein